MPFPDLGDPRIKACLRLPEAYRSLATSFFGSWCQGIPTCTHGSLTKFSLEIVSRTSLSLTPHCQRPSPRARTALHWTSLHRALPDSLEVRTRTRSTTGCATRIPSRSTAPMNCRSHPCRASQRGRSLSTATLAPVSRRWSLNRPRLDEMETDGIEPTTFWLQTRCSTN